MRKGRFLIEKFDCYHSSSNSGRDNNVFFIVAAGQTAVRKSKLLNVRLADVLMYAYKNHFWNCVFKSIYYHTSMFQP